MSESVSGRGTARKGGQSTRGRTNRRRIRQDAALVLFYGGSLAVMWMLIAGVFGAGTLAQFTDWLFMGVLFHDAYNRYPEVWRLGIREGKERRAIIWSSLIGYVMTGAIFVLCAWSGVHSIALGLAVAVVAWIAGPLSIVVINGFFMRIDPKITLSHCIGHLARFGIAGAAAGFVFSSA